MFERFVGRRNVEDEGPKSLADIVAHLGGDPIVVADQIGTETLMTFKRPEPVDIVAAGRLGVQFR